MKKFCSVLIAFAIANLLIFGCSKKEEGKKGVINVFTSILPQEYFVKKIGGELVNVSVLVGPGKSPATYEPVPDQVVALGKADILFTIGVPFENAFLPKINSLKSLKITDTSLGIKKRMLESHDHEEGNEHGEDEHDDKHAETSDPHIWLSPSLVKIQAMNIYKALSETDPEEEPVYKKGYDNFIEELDSVDKELKAALKPFNGKILFVFHPAFGYFADEYGLKQVAIETGGKEPSPSTLQKIIIHAKKENVKIIFLQPEFSQKSGQAIAEAIGGAVVMLNPLNPDYINNLKHIADEIKTSFK